MVLTLFLISKGNEGDERTLDKLFDGTNVTTDDVHMWLTVLKEEDDDDNAVNDNSPPPSSTQPTIHVDLTALREGGCPVAGLRLWNYNKSVEVTGSLSFKTTNK